MVDRQGDAQNSLERQALHCILIVISTLMVWSLELMILLRQVGLRSKLLQLTVQHTITVCPAGGLHSQDPVQISTDHQRRNGD